MPVPNPILTPHDKTKAYQQLVRKLEDEEDKPRYRGSHSWWLKERAMAQRVAAGAMCIFWTLPIAAGVQHNTVAALSIGAAIVAIQAALIIAAHRNIHKARIQFVLERMGVTPGDDA